MKRAALFLILLFSAPAAAQDAGTLGDELMAPTQAGLVDLGDPEAVGKRLVEAAESRDWGLVVALSLVACVWVCRTFGGRLPGKVGAFLTSDRGGAALALGGSVGASIATGLLAGRPFSVGMLTSGLLVGAAGMGLFSGAKKMIKPPAGSP